MALVYIGLGTNLGDRQANLDQALEKLEALHGTTILNESPVEETDPVDYLNQPRFLNQVVLVNTELQPEDLLRKLKDIEVKLGRKPAVPKGPRIIDLDILLYDDYILASETLEIPHPGITDRPFVMRHLLALSPALRDPVSGKPYQEILHDSH